MLELKGALQPWLAEVRGMIANVAKAETAEHPLERLMPTQVGEQRVLVPTTGMHLARRIVSALVRRFRRNVRLTFDENVTTIEWL